MVVALEEAAEWRFWERARTVLAFWLCREEEEVREDERRGTGAGGVGAGAVGRSHSAMAVRAVNTRGGLQICGLHVDF